jgi:alpha-beta hydrolase superfamily lysophospholipase
LTAQRVVLIHGAWVNALSWERFAGHYGALGVETIAPSWPHLDGDPRGLRAAVDPALARVGITELVDHYAAIVAAEAAPPVLIGHSFGGLIVQLLLERGLGAVGVAIDPAPPRGVLARPVAIRANANVLLTPLGFRRVIRPSLKAWSWAFVHTLPADEQAAAYERYVVPTTGKLFHQAALGLGTAISWKRADRAPLLITAGELDHAVDRRMNESNFRRYRGLPQVEFKQYPGRTHWLIADDRFAEVADDALAFARRHGALSSSS